MKKIICLLALIGLFVNVNAQRVFIKHTIKTGESVGSIAKYYDVTTDDIYKFNDTGRYLKNISYKTGDEIRIPYYGSKKFRLKKDDGVLVVPDFTSDPDKPVDMPLDYKPGEYEQQYSVKKEQPNERDKFSKMLAKANDMIKSGQALKGLQHYVNYIKVLKSDDGDFLLSVAELTDRLRNDLNKYNREITSRGNMYNAAEVMAESYNLSLLEIEMNTLRVQFAIQSAQLGNEDAIKLLNKWGMHINVNKPFDGYQNNGSNYNNQPYNNSYQNNGTNEARKKQLLDNIETYEKRIAEIERQKGSGIATNMMGNQTISNYRRMIEDAKRELRSMGYNIY